MSSSFFRRKQQGFTVLEILTVIIIIIIISLLLLPVLKTAREKAEKAKCMASLKSLAVAANGYIQANGHWPQVSTATMSSDYPSYANSWKDALRPFGIAEENWICPTIQRLLGNPDLTKKENARIDFVPMPFDDRQMTPYLWPKHPWFVERGDVHGNGNLVIYTNGSVEEVGNIMPKGKLPR